MTLDLHTVTAWEAPAWATDRDLSEVFVDHRHEVGQAPSVDGSDQVTVILIQRDEVTTDGQMAISRGEAQICVAGVRMDAAGARQLGALLNRAADLMTSGQPN